MSIPSAIIAFMTGWTTAAVLSYAFFGSWKKGFQYFYAWIRPIEAPDMETPAGDDEASTQAQIASPRLSLS